MISLPPLEAYPALELDETALERNFVIGFMDNDIRSRPFSLLRSRVLKEMKGESTRVIGCTSGSPGVGKSFITLNLAAAISCLPDRTVYLLDVDLKRATIADVLGLEQELWLDDYLRGTVNDLASIGCRPGGGNLVVLPCMKNRRNTAALLAGQRFGELLQALRAHDENAIVICDMPPAFASDDALIVNEQLDGYLLVVEQGNTSKREVRSTIETLSPTPLLGSVVNRYSGGFFDPYGYGYGDGYGYGKYGDYYDSDD